MANFVRVIDYEEHSKTFLPKTSFEFFGEGSGHQETVTNNIKAYKRYRIRPRYLHNVEKRILSRNILGKPVSIPIGISPTAAQRIAHDDGECATARAMYQVSGILHHFLIGDGSRRREGNGQRANIINVSVMHIEAAQELGTIFILSSHSTSTIEEVVEAAPKGRKWLQCYVFKAREITRELAAKVERAGFEAIVLTLDFPVLGLRYSARKHQYYLPKHLTMGVLEKYFENGVPHDISDPSADWSYIKWLKSVTKLPIVAKGILTAEDAIRAVDAGVSAILVSNHGGRQLDGLPSTIESLPEIVQAVGDKVEVYLDGGIRDGVDVFKALALGAKMVFVGRPAIWGLAHSGEEGVKGVLNILQNELDKAIAISGCSSLDEITRDRVVHESYYSKI